MIVLPVPRGEERQQVKTVVEYKRVTKETGGGGTSNVKGEKVTNVTDI